MRRTASSGPAMRSRRPCAIGRRSRSVGLTARSPSSTARRKITASGLIAFRIVLGSSPCSSTRPRSAGRGCARCRRASSRRGRAAGNRAGLPIAADHARPVHITRRRSDAAALHARSAPGGLAQRLARPKTRTPRSTPPASGCGGSSLGQRRERARHPPACLSIPTRARYWPDGRRSIPSGSFGARSSIGRAYSKPVFTAPRDSLVHPPAGGRRVSRYRRIHG